ncbi:hypothetical protein Bca4012_024332 [Brassica carinata]
MGNCCSQGRDSDGYTQEKGITASTAGNQAGPTAEPSVPQSKHAPPSPPPATKQGPIGPVLGRPMEDVKSSYSLGKELGRGQFGVTHLCTHKATGQQFACKTIAKRKLVNKEDIEDVRREVQIMHHLTGQANIVELKGAYEDKHSVHLVMELCAVGSAYYIAPEVLKRKYGPEADIWSIGVMLYILLCGVPPFWAESENGIFNAILKGHVDFSSDPWPSISPQAKDLVKKMLNSDPKQRLTAAQVLNHPWIKEDGEAPDVPLDNAVMSRLKQFKAMNNFKKVALRVIAGCLSEEEIMGLKEMFKGMDTDSSGTITLEELRQGLAKQGTRLSEYEVQQLMEAADADGNGTIDYEEFIAATMHINKLDREEHLYSAFQHFDKDNSGYITMEELEQALREFGMNDGRDIKEIISEVDGDNDGRINYDEFVAMMRKGNPDPIPKKRRELSFK